MSGQLGLSAALALAISAGLTLVLHSVLLRLGRVDEPDARRLHSRPVPRGGGVAVAVVFSVALAAADLPADLRWPWLALGLGYAALGAWDDWRSRRADVRLALHLVLAALFIAVLPVRPEWPLGAPLGLALLLLAVVWCVNLFNFMDGADGIAAAQATAVAVAMAALFARVEAMELARLQLVLAASCAGFLVFNWQPARIFLGDVGSYLLGFQWVAATWLAWHYGLSPAAPLILCAPFVIDATLTLATRAVRGERFWHAHRAHLYQRLVLGGWSPRRLVGVLVVVDVTVCWPLAWIAAAGGVTGWTIAGGVYGGFALIWYTVGQRFPAGSH